MVKGDRRGASLGGLLLMVLVLTVLGFSLAQLSVVHLQMSGREGAALEAKNLARSVVSAAIARILDDPTFGESNPDSAQIELPHPEGRGYLTFSPQAEPHSSNNLAGTSAVVGSGGVSVGPATVHLVAVARVRGVERTVRAVLRVPPFPWAIASGGTIETQNGVLVGSLPPGVWPPPPDDELLPADLLANSNASEAVVLGDDSVILGDVETPGQVSFAGQSVNVHGEVRSGIAPVELPRLRAADYDPQTMGLDYDNLDSLQDPGNTVTITGTARRNGTLVLDHGLRLEGSHLFVDGDLTVRGGVEGNGVVVATGDVHFESGLTLEGATELALLTDGRAQLVGRGRASSTVRGVIYADEGLEAQEMTLVGSLLAGNSQAGVGLDDVRFIAEEPGPAAVQPVNDTFYYIGRVNRSMTTNVVTLTEAIETEVPGYELGFVLWVQAGPGGSYPLTLTLQPGYLPANGTWTLQGPEDIPGVELALTGALTSLTGFDETGLAWVANFMSNHPLEDLISGGGGSSRPGGSIDLYGDISRFLPLKDRIRVVSWFED